MTTPYEMLTDLADQIEVPKNGTLSRIVCDLQPGAGVVTSRNDVHYVVTEFGTAYLHGKTIRERADALILIADPRFQERLEEAARELGYYPQIFAPISTIDTRNLRS